MSCWQQLELALEWGSEPWGGRTPRSMTRGACVVDKSEVSSASGDAKRVGPDPAQFTMFLKGTPSNGS